MVTALFSAFRSQPNARNKPFLWPTNAQTIPTFQSSMDPVTAFAIAGTILQFIDSSTQFIVLARKLYYYGSDDDGIHTNLLKITEDLDTILPKLSTTQHADAEEQSLSQLALDCAETAGQLLDILRNVKLPQKSRKRDAIKAAFQLTCKEEKIKSLQDQLYSFRNQLNLHLLVSLR